MLVVVTDDEAHIQTHKYIGILVVDLINHVKFNLKHILNGSKSLRKR